MHPIASLINACDDISEEHEEIGDTDVREQLSELLIHILMNPSSATFPDSLGMFTPEGNLQLVNAVRLFRDEYLLSDGLALPTEVDARRYIQSPGITGISGNNSSYYLGHVPVDGEPSLVKPLRPWWKIF
jgi:hypothetical protein